MLDQKDILIFFHLMALIAGLGGSIFHIFILPSILQDKSNQKERIPQMIRAINVFSPINFGMLTVIVFTGIILIFNLYDKISNISSPLYLNIFLVKIILVTTVFAIAAYQTFNLRFKIVYLKIDKKNEGKHIKLFGIMRTCSMINIVLITIALLLGITMGRLA